MFSCCLNSVVGKNNFLFIAQVEGKHMSTHKLQTVTSRTQQNISEIIWELYQNISENINEAATGNRPDSSELIVQIPL